MFALLPRPGDGPASAGRDSRPPSVASPFGSSLPEAGGQPALTGCGHCSCGRKTANAVHPCRSPSSSPRQRSRNPCAARFVPVCVFACRSRRPADGDRMRTACKRRRRLGSGKHAVCVLQWSFARMRSMTQQARSWEQASHSSSSGIVPSFKKSVQLLFSETYFSETIPPDKGGP